MWPPRSTWMGGRSGLTTVASWESQATTCPLRLGTSAARAAPDRTSGPRAVTAPVPASILSASRRESRVMTPSPGLGGPLPTIVSFRGGEILGPEPGEVQRVVGGRAEKEAALAHAIELKLPQRDLLLRQRLLCECSLLYGLEPGPKFGILGLRGFHGLLQPLFFLLQDCGAFFQGLHRDHKHPRHVGGRNGRWCSNGADAVVPEGGKELLGDRTVVAGLFLFLAHQSATGPRGGAGFSYHPPFRHRPGGVLLCLVRVHPPWS